MVRPDLVFQFLQQHTEVAASHVERFVIDIDGRDSLYAQTFYLVLIQSAVISWLIRGLTSAITFSACTTSGQFVQVRET